MPLFHVGAKYWQLATHMAGMPIYLHRRFDAHAAVETIERERITITHLAPTMLQAILDLPDLRARDLSSLHTISYGAAPMAEPLLRRAVEALGPIFVQRYGSTEAAAVTSLEKTDHVIGGTPDQARLLVSAGQPNVMTEIKIVRADGTECAPGEAGELLIHNPDLVMQGYWRNPEATAEAMRDGWFYTGDVGTIDERGYLTIVDRIKDMIISGGENIYPKEVEDALVQHPAVAGAAVIGVPDEKWGESVLAFVARNEGQDVEESELIEFCRSRVASYKKPSRIEFVDSLPHLASGKIDKVKLREPYWAGKERRV
jgi:acyl-CoA synthetase (AMP-forming)/AMP-acid ligase II